MGPNVNGLHRISMGNGLMQLCMVNDFLFYGWDGFAGDFLWDINEI